MYADFCICKPQRRRGIFARAVSFNFFLAKGPNKLCFLIQFVNCVATTTPLWRRDGNLYIYGKQQPQHTTWPSKHCLLFRGSWVCELWCYVHAPVEAGRERPLPLQRLRPLLQDERTESAAYQTQEKIGEFGFLSFFFYLFMINYLFSLSISLFFFNCIYVLSLFGSRWYTLAYIFFSLYLTNTHKPTQTHSLWHTLSDTLSFSLSCTQTHFYTHTYKVCNTNPFIFSLSS